jgi:hypothetical protein
MEPALAEAGLPGVKMLLQVHDELVFEVPEGDVEAASTVICRVMEQAALPSVTIGVPLGWKSAKEQAGAPRINALARRADMPRVGMLHPRFRRGTAGAPS